MTGRALLVAAAFATACARPASSGPVSSASNGVAGTSRVAPASRGTAPTTSSARNGVPPANSVRIGAAEPSASAAPSLSPHAPSGRATAMCGTVCAVYASSVDAFETVLARKPAILGVGEAHPLRGTEGVEPSVRRFTHDFLPLLRGVASDLVVELLLPNAACETATKEARKEQRVVTEHQAATDQNDFVALGSAARALGIRAHALEPTCDDLKRISSAGSDAVPASLDVVTRLSAEGLARYFDANVRAKDPRIVVGYGGAMHNDVAPRPGREAWSFGPAMSKLTAGRYVEVDLIVPEFVEDTPAWRSLPWFSAFDPAAHPSETTLLSPSPDAFVLIFARGVKTESSAPSPASSSGTR